uniref:Secreted protein n=1 Tax=Steinernema glaseri TaxID=37863 RepID=A0A1I8AJH7_9BILA
MLALCLNPINMRSFMIMLVKGQCLPSCGLLTAISPQYPEIGDKSTRVATSLCDVTKNSTAARTVWQRSD